MRASIRARRTWPDTSMTLARNPQVIDVDRYEDRAVVLCVFSKEGFVVTRRDTFQRRGRRWEFINGGGAGGGQHLLTLRELRPFGEEQKLRVIASGGGGGTLSAEILCLPEVARVEVRRKRGTRNVNVEHGPGLLAVLWLEGDQAELVAFDRDDNQICTLVPEHHAVERHQGSRQNFSIALTKDSTEDVGGSEDDADGSEDESGENSP
jgi:hypothetical protein